MSSPFPGMNPYLEHPRTWSNVHHRLITAIAIALAPDLRPKYRVVVEEAIYETRGQDSLLIGFSDLAVRQSPINPNLATKNTANTATLTKPEVKPVTVTLEIPQKIRQGYLEVRDITTSEVITVIEVLSPANKRPGAGRDSYCQKRDQILESKTNLVEIDLLRQWESLPMFECIESNYRILVSHSQLRPKAQLYPFNISDLIPSFPLPLRSDDPEPIIDLQSLLMAIYEQSGYDLVIDYQNEPNPPLSEADAIWVDNLLREQGLR